MSEPAKCPKCHAELRSDRYSIHVFDCGSNVDTVEADELHETSTCQRRQIAALQAECDRLDRRGADRLDELTALQAENQRLREALYNFIETVEIDYPGAYHAAINQAREAFTLPEEKTLHDFELREIWANLSIRVANQFHGGAAREDIARGLDLPLSVVDAAIREHVRTESN